MFGDALQQDPNETPSAPPIDNGPDPLAGRNADYARSITAWYQQYLGRTPAQAEIDSWINGGTPIGQVQGAIQNSKEGLAYAAKQNAPPGPPGGPPEPPGPPGPPGGPPANVGGLIQPFGMSFAAPTPTAYPGAPSFTPPSMGDAANDPGYMFSLNQGKKNLESWLSAHGTFNDSSAAEALQDYGRNAATTQYGNVWNRQFQAYQGALQPWQTDTARIQHDNDTGWQNAFNTWLQNWNVWKDQRDSTFDKQFKTATA